MVKLNYCLIKPNHISQILYSLSHRRNKMILALCPGQRTKHFYSLVNINANYKNIRPLTCEEYISSNNTQQSTVVIMNPPNTFEALNDILTKAQKHSQEIILTVLQVNKKYLNIIGKKIKNLELKEMIYSPNKFVGINDKIRDFVDKSYDMNRAGFYAYGQYINYYRGNLLKKIFRTELIKVDDLARSYGFTSALRVKQGTFLKPAAQKAKQAQKKAQKRRKKRENALKQHQQLQNLPIEQQEKYIQPVKKSIPKKGKKILKNKSLKPNKIH